MSTLKGSPGPVAQSAFKTGMVAATLLGVAAIGSLYWAGVLNLVLAAYLSVLVFPLYLVLAASAINVWLGYGKDVTDLRPVYQRKDS